GIEFAFGQGAAGVEPVLAVARPRDPGQRHTYRGWTWAGSTTTQLPSEGERNDSNEAGNGRPRRETVPDATAGSPPRPCRAHGAAGPYRGAAGRAQGGPGTPGLPAAQERDVRAARLPRAIGRGPPRQDRPRSNRPRRHRGPPRRSRRRGDARQTARGFL